MPCPVDEPDGQSGQSDNLHILAGVYFGKVLSYTPDWLYIEVEGKRGYTWPYFVLVIEQSEPLPLAHHQIIISQIRVKGSTVRNAASYPSGVTCKIPLVGSIDLYEPIDTDLDFQWYEALCWGSDLTQIQIPATDDDVRNIIEMARTLTGICGAGFFAVRSWYCPQFTTPESAHFFGRAVDGQLLDSFGRRRSKSELLLQFWQEWPHGFGFLPNGAIHLDIGINDQDSRKRRWN